MNREQSRAEPLSPVVAVDTQGGRHIIERAQEFKRVLYADNTWSNWAPGQIRMRLNGMRVTALDDQTVQVHPSLEVLTLVS